MSTSQITTAQNFESKPCGRCGGSGNHSYCQMYGTTCFECRGKGKVYTKRGSVASQYMKSLRTVKASEVQTGWLIYVGPSPLGGYKPGWHVVTAAGPSDCKAWSTAPDGSKIEHSYILIETEKAGGQNVFPDSNVIAVAHKNALAATRAAALQYQERLTKAGIERRRAA